MRTLALLAMTGLMAAAEEPKKTPEQLSTAEVVALTTIAEKMAVLEKQAKALQEQQKAIVGDACKRAGIATDACEIKQDGTIAKREAKK